MTITKWHTFLKKSSEQTHGKDIALQDHLLIGTWFCFDMANRSLLWEGPGKANAANVIVGIYQNIVVAMHSTFLSYGGFYRIDLRTGRLLPDSIRLRPYLWFFKKESSVYAIELYGHCAFLSDDTIVDVVTGERIEANARELFATYSYHNTEVPPADEIFVDNRRLCLRLTIGTWTDPAVRWYSHDGDHVSEATIPGCFHTLERFTRTSGESVLILRNLLNQTIYLMYYDTEYLVQENLQLNIAESRIRMNNDYLVISNAGYRQQNIFHHIYRIAD
ncbi:MAG: hypothetical protein EOP06_21050 [Proteobacteria bacterium]|nr:MAG: hypothetical protein EOP06_21050 [Pseudomonadota bacterium]